VAALLARDPAVHASLEPDAAVLLLSALPMAGADEQAAALLARDPAAHADLGDPGAVAWLLDALRGALGLGCGNSAPLTRPGAPQLI
jgi:hypothetical protein